MTDVRARAEAWLAEDPDPDTRAELQALLDADDAAGLADRFAGFLQFGTAGLRGAVGAGPNRMNRSVVQRAAAGLGRYLQENGGGAVVIGFDARHKSDLFAHDTAMVLSGLGLPAMVLPEPLPTPVLAFAIRHLGCAAGVMVTASHNPPQDNGYKVYLGDGSQIVPPADAEIAARIAEVGPLASIAHGEEWVTLGEDLLAAYLDRLATLPAAGGPRDLVIAYTPMHGVGGETLTAAFARAGFPPLLPVAAQAAPDPDFPTVAFPNPEEPGAMDLAVAAARAGDADLVIANDPDADRCAVAVPDATAPDGWRALRGDEVGALLGAHLLDRGVRGTFANSIVSGSLLARICEAAGVRHEQTLTGFKWISKVPDLAFGYEEALGYCVDPSAVNDKDGVSAALLVAELAAELKAQRRTLLDRLDDLALAHGLHATDQLSIRVEELSRITETMDRLRQSPPTEWGGRAVLRVEDLAQGEGGLPPTDGLRFTLADGARVIVRPSGTEPKLKCYLEVVIPVATRADLPAARAAAAEALTALKTSPSVHH